MNTFEAIKKAYPEYTHDDWLQYVHWSKNSDILENWLFTTFHPTAVNETEANALKRLGKLEMIIGLMNLVKTTKKCIQQLDVASQPLEEGKQNVK